MSLSIELEINEPILVASDRDLLQLHPSQIEWISLTLIQEGCDSAPLTCRLDKSRSSIQDLVSFVTGCQPAGTGVKLWYRGRAETFTFLAPESGD